MPGKSHFNPLCFLLSAKDHEGGNCQANEVQHHHHCQNCFDSHRSHHGRQCATMKPVSAILTVGYKKSDVAAARNPRAGEPIA